jgi:hypothetical protein
LRGGVGKQRRFLGARDRDWPVLCRNRAETIEFDTAELGRIDRFAIAAATDRLGAEGHRAVTRADQDTPGISHRVHDLFLLDSLLFPQIRASGFLFRPDANEQPADIHSAGVAAGSSR